MSLVSIFVNKPPIQFSDLSDPENRELGVDYHFDAIPRYNLEMSVSRSKYPLEFGADAQDHASINPSKVTLYGTTGSRELRFSVNQLPALGASALIGSVNNPVLSAAAGIAGDVLANSSFLGGEEQTRGGATLTFLKDIMEKFLTFTLVTELISIPHMQIDSISTEVNTDNETGLEFVAELSQQRFTGETAEESNVNLPEDDPAISQAESLIERGKVAIKEVADEYLEKPREILDRFEQVESFFG